MKLLNNITVTKRKKYSHIIGNEFENEIVTVDQLNNILADTEELSDDNEIINIKNGNPGNYSLTDGDFWYYIEIK